MRYDGPALFAELTAALVQRRQLLAQVVEALADLPAGELSDCFCALADAAQAAHDAGWNGGGGGPGPGPGGNPPGDGSNPDGWNDPNADPTTLLYECHIFTIWEFYTETTEGDTYYQIRMDQESIPNTIGNTVGAYELNLTGGRWYAITPINWPNGHTMMFPTFGQGDENNPYTIGSGEAGTAYYFEPDSNAIFFDITLVTKNPPAGTTGYRLCAAVPA